MRLLSVLLLFTTTVAWGRSAGPSLDAVADMSVETEEPSPAIPGPPCSDLVLRDGVQLPEQPGLFVIANKASVWGTATMIQTLQAAAEELAWQLPGADPIYVGDISLQHGGYYEGHRSHRGGVDADVGLYTKGGHQPAHGFDDVSTTELDAHATWTFMRALFDTGNVERIYLDQSLINVLRKYVHEQEGLSSAEVDKIFPPPGSRTWEMSGVVQHVSGHRNHMHVRVLCSDGQHSH